MADMVDMQDQATADTTNKQLFKTSSSNIINPWIQGFLHSMKVIRFISFSFHYWVKERGGRDGERQ
jgi:hypothetical protein